MKILLWTVGITFGVFLLSFAGIGLMVWIGRRKRPNACSCSFDPETARRNATRPCDGAGKKKGG